MAIHIRRRELLVTLGGAAAWPLAAWAQQPAVPVVGFLNSASADAYARFTAAFHQGLAETGFVVGQNVAIEYRWADGHYERLPALAVELVRLGVAMIAANGPAAPPAKAATTTIPIVFTAGFDPIELGLITSLSRPGGNLTGVSILNVELGPKRLQLLHEVVPTAAIMALNYQSEQSQCREPNERPAGGGRRTRTQTPCPACEHRWSTRGRVRNFGRAASRRAADRARSILQQPEPSACHAGRPSRDAGNLSVSRVRRGRWPDELRRQPDRRVPSSRHLCWPDSGRCQAGRPARRTVHEGRADHQHENRQGARIDNSAPANRPRRRGDRMKRRECITLLGVAAAWPLAARAQQAGKIYRIGVFTAGAPIRSKTWSILIDALKELGWTEGKNIVFEPRFADNNLDRLPELAAELVSLNVDVILAIGTLAPLAAKRASATTPIVMANAGDPLGSGLVVRLARPGGNVTGMSLMALDLGGKRLELLKEILPRLSRVAVIWNAANPYSALVFEETRGAAKTLAIELTSVEVRVPGDFTGALDSAVRKRVEALVAVEDPLKFNFRKQIAEFCAENRLPAIFGLREYADDGGLMAYGASQEDLLRRGGYVDKILKGVKPGDLPVQQPTKFELVINLKTAKALGLEVPPTLLARADEVID